MARQFVAASAQSLNYFGAVISTLFSNSTGTMALWHKPTGVPASHAMVFNLPRLVADTGQYVGLHRGSTDGENKIWAYNWDGSDDHVGFTYTNDVWVHVIWRHVSGTLDVFKDGVLAGSLASGNTADVSGTLRYGEGLDGDLAEHAIWNVALDDAECAALGKGFSPFLIRPTSLTRYCPLIGRTSPEPDLIEAAVATHNNNPLVADHPRMIYPSAARVLKWPAGVVVGDAVPQVWASYRRRRAS